MVSLTNTLTDYFALITVHNAIHWNWGWPFHFLFHSVLLYPLPPRSLIVRLKLWLFSHWVMPQMNQSANVLLRNNQFASSSQEIVIWSFKSADIGTSQLLLNWCVNEWDTIQPILCSLCYHQNQNKCWLNRAPREKPNAATLNSNLVRPRISLSLSPPHCASLKCCGTFLGKIHVNYDTRMRIRLIEKSVHNVCVYAGARAGVSVSLCGEYEWKTKTAHTIQSINEAVKQYVIHKNYNNWTVMASADLWTKHPEACLQTCYIVKQQTAEQGFGCLIITRFFLFLFKWKFWHHLREMMGVFWCDFKLIRKHYKMASFTN